jgi:hypothetical protein
MLCTTCLGVLEECRNLIVDKSDRWDIPETMAGKSIFRQGTIDTTAPTSDHKGKLAQHLSYIGPCDIYGHHTTLADLKTAARIGCQICWQVWDVLSNDRFKVADGVLEAHEAVESAKTHFCTCLVLNRYISKEMDVAIYYDGIDSPQRVCRFTLYSKMRMYGVPSNCYNC